MIGRAQNTTVDWVEVMVDWVEDAVDLAWDAEESQDVGVDWLHNDWIAQKEC